ncbi:MAG: chaperone modulator CbpM [Paludibacter sp.]|nr:chaperone modulator CbpM [Paludibacter sp.]
MQTEYLIAIDEFCAKHDIEVSFISSLQQTGLIEITTIEEVGFIPIDQIRQLETFMRFYYELDINLEGIETISHLLHRVNDLQEEIIELRNRLGLYE